MRRILMLLAMVTLIAAACGGDDDAAAGLSVASSDLGEILVDADGMTLYLFTNDTPGESVCYDVCEDNWPPLYEDELGDLGGAIDEALLGTTARTDGTVQVTYAGRPLYRFAADAEPGDVTGQGLNDVWWVVAPSGEAIGG